MVGVIGYGPGPQLKPDGYTCCKMTKTEPATLKINLLEDFPNVVLLVFANKQDFPNAMNAAEITDKLGLHSLRQCYWYIQSTCATSGEGLYAGLDWLSNNIANKASCLSGVLWIGDSGCRGEYHLAFISVVEFFPYFLLIPTN
ncbi:hypothetical protein KIW84_023535 [Lathyrus oleraceus]|uniref:ADP-ribosylation factor n=1 Tax=Pisum sativum TaxID=3888 RepID=A0A9D4YHQ2_PEA|nr:hypothetical protein KIW84_023535 [Pisum sativum]